MTEFFTNFQPIGMNFGRFHSHVYEFCRFEDARPIQICSVVIKILKDIDKKSYPSTKIKVENRPM